MHARTDHDAGLGSDFPERRNRPSVGSIAVIAVVVVQVAVPLGALLLPPPQRFGFQMYSAYGMVSAVQTDAEARETRIEDLDSFVGNLRVDVDWVAVLPEELCARLPDAVTVTVRQSERERTARCS